MKTSSLVIWGVSSAAHRKPSAAPSDPHLKKKKLRSDYHRTLEFNAEFYFLAVLVLGCCTRAFSCSGEWGLLCDPARGLLIAVASLAVEHGLEGVWVSVAVAHQFSRPKACGVFQTGDRTCVLCIGRWIVLKNL